MILYNTEHAHVEATPRRDGTVRIAANQGRAGDVRYPNYAHHNSWWIGRLEPRTWWKPWTWWHLTPEQALRRAIRAADAYGRKQEEAQFGLVRARRAVEGLQAQADALASLEAELSQ